MWFAGLIFLLNVISTNDQVSLPDFLPGTAVFKPADGYWSSSENWTGTRSNVNNGLPARQMDCSITGAPVTARVNAQHIVSSVQLGFYLGDSAVLNVAGTNADLVVLTKLRVGEYNYSHTTPNTNPATARLHISSGAKIRGSDLCIGPGRSQRTAPDLTGFCQGIFRIFGGRVAFRDVFMALGVGGKGTLEINGSVADSIEVMDYLQMGTSEVVTTNDWDTTSSLKFILDTNGVTPITIYNFTTDGGLRLDIDNPPELENKNIRSLTVSIASGHEPPNGDIVLIDCSRPIRGHFTGLEPDVNDLHIYAASSGGKEYRWMLTYTGGADGCDLVLTNAELKVGGNWTGYTGGAAQRSYTFDPAVWDFPAPPAVTFAGVKAFPTAEGFGACSRGGRGGMVYHVTNLADTISGTPAPGSLRAAVESSGARTVVFDVGGVIYLDKPLRIINPYLTLAGQTAPGSGICVAGDNVVLQNTHDIIVRYMKFRPGLDSGAPDGDAVSIFNSYNCIIDHCSLSWSRDELLSITGLADLNTIQWCILAEPLNSEGHGYLSILGGERSTWSHNLIAHVNNRLPKFYSVCRVDWRDNVVYNWNGAAYGAFAGLNFVNNWYKCGTNTTAANKRFYSGRSFVKDNAVFIQHNAIAEQNAGSQTRVLITNICDNIQDGPGAIGDNWNGMGEMDEASRAVSASSALTRPYTLADDTYALASYNMVPVYSGAGKNNGTANRDATDIRIINEFLYGTGAIKNIPPADPAVSPWFSGAPTDKDCDTDRDGMPDSWEAAHTFPQSGTGLNSNDDRDNDGYSNLEEYLNSLVTGNH